MRKRIIRIAVLETILGNLAPWAKPILLPFCSSFFQKLDSHPCKGGRGDSINVSFITIKRITWVLVLLSILGLSIAVSAQDGSTPKEKPKEQKEKTQNEEYQRITFALLSEYNGYSEIEGEEGTIPGKIKALKGKKVEIAGFMISLYGFEDIKEFILAPIIPECFYCQPPEMNQMIMVKMTGKDKNGKDKTVDFFEVPIKVKGKLDMGEEFVDGALISIYRLSAETVEETKEKDIQVTSE